MPHQVRELHYAVVLNDLDTVRELMSQGVNINFPWYNSPNISVKDGSTPLINAVSLNYIELVETLVYAGAYINKCDRNGCTPLYKAAFHGRPALIELLSRSGADVNLPDFMGKTPLYICVNNAIVHSCMLAVQKLLAEGAIVDKQDRKGHAPVHIASQWKNSTILKMLIKANSNPNIVDNKGRTPLFICVSSLSTKLYKEDLLNMLPCVCVLYSAGADMLNLTEWLLYKGPGISDDLMRYTSSADFQNWYQTQIRQPQSLKNTCRKTIQMRLSRRGPLVEMCHKLPIPTSLQAFLSRKMFYREENFT